MMHNKKIFDFIFLFKVIAILFITNSHMKPIYNDIFSQLAFGGAFGCALFFFCSGFTIKLNHTENFFQYITKRFIRIYPPVWIFLIITQSYNSWKDLFWYDRYWFLQAILIFYILLYFVQKYLIKYITWIITFNLIILLSIYAYIPHQEWIIDYSKEPHHITWIYYFCIMLLGTYFRLNQNKIRITIKINPFFKFMSLLLCFLSIYSIKLFCTKNIIPINFQIAFPIGLIISCILLYILFKDVILTPRIQRIIKYTFEITLELYIVQFSCIYFAMSYPFPLRLLIAFLLIPIAAILLHYITNILTNKIFKIGIMS